VEKLVRVVLRTKTVVQQYGVIIIIYLFVYLFILMPTSTKPVAVNMKQSINCCNGDSFGGHCVLEGDHATCPNSQVLR